MARGHHLGSSKYGAIKPTFGRFIVLTLRAFYHPIHSNIIALKHERAFDSSLLPEKKNRRLILHRFTLWAIQAFWKQHGILSHTSSSPMNTNDSLQSVCGGLRWKQFSQLFSISKAVGINLMTSAKSHNTLRLLPHITRGCHCSMYSQNIISICGTHGSVIASPFNSNL